MVMDSLGNWRPLAERMLPKARKTGVKDMLETPQIPTLARIMRITPRADERPAKGLSWADYEDVDLDVANATKKKEKKAAEDGDDENENEVEEEEDKEEEEEGPFYYTLTKPLPPP
ncbi:hypothetical protein H0H93_013488, partial [Arthromyces matolae]